eukprot:scaffold116973_cov25-Attheya_sp.AAC.1
MGLYHVDSILDVPFKNASQQYKLQDNPKAVWAPPSVFQCVRIFSLILGFQIPLDFGTDCMAPIKSV